MKVILDEIAHPLDVLCISESWLDNSTADLVHIPNFEHFSICRENRRDGGVSMFTNVKFKTRVLTEVSVLPESH